ncbi:sister chromatid cohesion protein SCC4 isoform X2 [Capsicum annuum]|uniref:sister chromatid cohesion protein SCC4 isoform X2 n=1 Tax=Capsicum annuum TaxID=4072 RepID=UPI001FB119EC|nr:sister chromatid cohesion protein SCC4 isoform X2 [Capsicum annuum]
MERVAEGLWVLADYEEKKGEIGKSVKCLEAICQSQVSFLPIIEIKTRLRIANLLLNHSNNVNHAKSHLERSQLLLKSIPSCFELKCRAYSLLSQCYQLVGAIPSQKQILNKGLELISTSEDGFSGRLWYCNFNSQLANALTIEGDHHGSISALDNGLTCATQMCYPELQMFFATSILHVHLMQWENESSVQDALNRCNVIWESIESVKRQQCLGLLFYNELLHVFYLLRICDYKNAVQHVDKLDAAMKSDLQRRQRIKDLTKELDAVNESLPCYDLSYRDRSSLSAKQTHLGEQLNNLTGNDREFSEPKYFGSARRTWEDKLELAPPPIDGEWLPKGAIYALVDLTVAVFNRPKGLFKECLKRIQSGLQIVQEELKKYGILDGVRVDLQHTAIWIASVYLMLLMQLLENKVAVDLTRSEFVEAQEALVQMRNWYIRFPTILQACECVIEMLRGQYAHCVGCYDEANYHFLEASRLSENKSMQAMCCVYAAISYICMGDAESSAKALDLIGPVLGVMDSFTGVREKTSVLLAHGFLLMRQQNLQEARNRLAFGLQTTHNTLGNLQLVSQYLTVLGNLGLALCDTVQAREILRSSLTLAKKLNDIPTQIWVLSNLTAMYQQLGEKGSEMENHDYKTKKVEDLQKRISNACLSSHHVELIAKVKVEAHQMSEIDIKRAISGSSMRVDLDIPESIGLETTSPMTSSSRLMDFDMGRLRKRKA